MTTRTPTDEPLMTTEEAAALLKLSPKTLQQWRSDGKGPAFVKLEGDAVRYTEADLMAWLARQRPEEMN